MNLPNLLTAIRMALVPVFAALLLSGHIGWALCVFLLAGITDVFDGYIARVYDLETRLGAILDPLADKVLLITAYLLLAALTRVPLWLTVAVVARDLVLLLGIGFMYWFSGHLHFSPTLAGKATTALQLITIAANLLSDFLNPVRHLLGLLYIVTMALTILSGVRYLYGGLGQLAASPMHKQD